jgi:hypothetical protein
MLKGSRQAYARGRLSQTESHDGLLKLCTVSTSGQLTKDE